MILSDPYRPRHSSSHSFGHTLHCSCVTEKFGGATCAEQALHSETAYYPDLRASCPEAVWIGEVKLQSVFAALCDYFAFFAVQVLT
jgi:hypothetical protein